MGQQEQSGLIATVYRAADGLDCTLGGISSKAKEVLVILPEGGPFSVADAAKLGLPVLRKRKLAGAISLIPNDAGDHDGHMFGGNFAYSSDGRWPNWAPIAIHDRIESPELARQTND